MTTGGAGAGSVARLRLLRGTCSLEMGIGVSGRLGIGIGAVAPPGGGAGGEVEANGVYRSLGSLAGPYPEVRATAPLAGGGGGGL